MFSFPIRINTIFKLEFSGLLFLYITTSTITYAQIESGESSQENPTKTQKVEYYSLEYKKYSRTIRIEKPPISETATSTPISVNEKPKNKSQRNIIVDKDIAAALGKFSIDVTIKNQVCEEGSILNRASFTVCNNEEENLIFMNANDLEHATQERGKLIRRIGSDSCEDIFVVGDDSDLQFDCSGIFSLTFHARLVPSNLKTYFNVPLK